MSEQTTYTEQGWHRRQAVECFNAVWTLLDKPSRTQEEDDTMIHTAHASRYHWGHVGTPVNLVRGEWQISRVYAALGQAESALAHARRCLELCEQHGIGDFDLAYAYEAMARAAAVAGDSPMRGFYLRKAEQAAPQIAEEDDRNLLLSDLTTIPEVRV